VTYEQALNLLYMCYLVVTVHYIALNLIFVADKGTVSRRVGAGCGPSDAGGAPAVPRSGAGESARRLQRPLPGAGGSALSSRQQYCLQH
jgi:hypothetical protein